MAIISREACWCTKSQALHWSELLQYLCHPLAAIIAPAHVRWKQIFGLNRELKRWSFAPASKALTLSRKDVLLMFHWPWQWRNLPVHSTCPLHWTRAYVFLNPHSDISKNTKVFSDKSISFLFNIKDKFIANLLSTFVNNLPVLKWKAGFHQGRIQTAVRHPPPQFWKTVGKTVFVGICRQSPSAKWGRDLFFFGLSLLPWLKTFVCLYVTCLYFVFGTFFRLFTIEYLPSFCIIRSAEQGYRYEGECEHPKN